MSNTFILLSTFLSVSLCIIGACWIFFDLFLRVRVRVDDRIKQKFRDETHERIKSSPLLKEFIRTPADEKPRLQDLGIRFQTFLDQSGLDLNVPIFFMLSGASAFSGAAAYFVVTRGHWGFAIAALVCGLLPALLVFSRRSVRTERLTQQLPEAFSAMSRGLKAGQAMPSVIQMIADDFPKPLSEEFTYYYEQQHLGVPHEVALRDMARRVNVMEMRILTIALIVQRRSGGNLAELLSKLADLVRKRVKMRQRVKSLTGEGRMQASVLIGMPFVVLAAMMLVAPDYAGLLLERKDILAGCLVSQGIGAYCIYRIVNFSF